MARIRKKTSKRGTTNQGARIVKKAKETRKKNKRAAKRDVTWKSKKEKDPGIPNSYPYKDQVLAELAAEKRATAEEKLARIEAAKAARKAAAEEEEDVPGILNLRSNKVLDRNANAAEAGPSSPLASPPPELIDNALPTLQAAIDRADVLLEVVDARDPMGCRSAWLEGLVASADGQVVIALTKIDLVPREAVTAWLNFLRPHFPTVLFKSAVPVAPLPRLARGQVAPPEDPARIRARSVLGKSGLTALLQQYSAAKKGKGKDEDLVVAVMGLPNVGKSSLINSFLPVSRLATAPQIPSTSSKRNAPTTAVPVEVVVEVTPKLQVCMIDTPGWEFDMEEDPEDGSEDDVEMDDASDAEGDEEAQQDKWDRLEEMVARDMLLRNLGRVDKVKDVAPLVEHIVARANTQDLMLCYSIPAFEAGDIDAFLTAVARASGRIKKHGVVDVEAAARILLRDWSHNTFPYYTLPPSGASPAELNEYDNAVLEGVLPRKELRRANAKGLVKMVGSPLDTREVVLDDDYTEALLPSDSEDEDELMEEDELDEDEDEEDDEEPEAEMWDGAGEEVILTNDDEPSDAEMSESEEEAPPPPPTRRQAKQAKASKPSKKVAFPSALEAPRSEPQGVAEPVGILKKTAKKAAKPVVKKAAPAPVKKAAPVKAAPVKAKATERVEEGEKPYDFGAHFF